MNDSIHFYQGQVFHARYRPRAHQFRYPVFFMRINLREWSTLKTTSWFGFDCLRPLAFYQRDHGPRDGSALLPWAQQLLTNTGIADPGGDLWLYTFPRVWGFSFKPVSFWHWHDTRGELRIVLAEVNNTFGERHIYLLQDKNGDAITDRSELSCSKIFHVSPFCDVSGQYRFQPAVNTRFFRMVIDHADAEGEILHTSLSGRPLPFTRQNAVRLLLRQPLMTMGVVFRIHWQALRLWIKGVPFFRKPSPPTVEVSS